MHHVNEQKYYFKVTLMIYTITEYENNTMKQLNALHSQQYLTKTTADKCTFLF